MPLSTEIRKQLTFDCAHFSKVLKGHFKGFLDIDLQEESDCQLATEFHPDHDLYFSVFFNGSVYGEFIVGMSRKTAMRLLSGGAEPESFDQLKHEIFDTFKEILNVAAAQSMEKMSVHFEQLTLTAPKITLGSLVLPQLPVYSNSLFLEGEEKVACYMYVDMMRLNLAKSYHEQKEELQRKEKVIQQNSMEQEQLRLLNRAKTEFLANMSHELRTPLNGMIGTLELVKQTSLSDIQRDQLGTIEQSGELLLGIINDILEFSKIESGKMMVESREFSLTKCVETTCKVLGAQSYKKSVDLFVEIDSSVPEIICSDETRIKQVLVNLVGNAIKFTPKGFVEVKVKVKDDFCVFEVKDNGIGIPEKKLKTIFEAFSQADVSDNRKYGGSGLGLTICKAIADALGGSIEVKSREAVGTKFTFRVPLITVKRGERPNGKGQFSIVSNGKRLRKNICHLIDRHQLGTVVEEVSSQELLLQKDKNSFGVLDYVNAADFNHRYWLMDWEIWRSESDQWRRKVLAHGKEFGVALVFLVPPNKVLEVQEYSNLLEGNLGGYLTLPVVPSDLLRLQESSVYFSFDKKIAESRTINENALASEAGLRRKILLVEDNFVNQQVAVAILKELGVDVEVANNGEEAIKKFSVGKFDLILMDCQMPVLNGFEATKHIRQQEALDEKKVPVIALTASAFRETKERCFECGMDDFITKPFKADALQEVILKNIGRSAS